MRNPVAVTYINYPRPTHLANSCLSILISLQLEERGDPGGFDLE
jgi:hypothetical protein